MPLLIAVAAYLLGSVPTAVLVCHAMGLADPRRLGSGNPGTTNVLRQGNRTAAVLTLLGDVAKGALAISLAQRAGLSPNQTGACAVAVLLGHIFPLLGYMRGGKGVATTFGLCLALSPPVGLLALGTWLLLAAIGKTASLASVGTALVTPLATYLLLPEQQLAISLICLLLVLRHRDNISRLLRGVEPRL
ncbi:glycerol-3-phosphate 1-O-acyltransferase PlsY [Marinobacterium rhizophilum]|uniref:glycerol-3-phosphate 1-O-acyltransferase PlsY n=1 Tax=Marinobacterium rhizophilum TaxID=420402 RepID=UPI00210336E9|nr:glycerol-3-phosphate 1-O-acyltransferase PlsY [Marinobacterium rhizophilum]